MLTCNVEDTTCRVELEETRVRSGMLWPIGDLSYSKNQQLYWEIYSRNV